MSHIDALDPAAASGHTRELLDAVKKGLGVVPNLFRVTAQSAVALEGMVGLNGAITKGTLGARIREAIALAVAEADGCDYCLSAHTYLGKHAGLNDADITLARGGDSSDPRIAAAARFARLLIEKRGHVTEADRTGVRAAGFGDAQILEIIANVAWSVFTNYVNVVAGTDIDFDPVVRHEVA
jgi:uncharacterized peroxidase-related enzyme